MTFNLAEVLGVLDGLYPPSTAEPWDAPGLVAGDPDAPVRRVMFAVDPVAEVIAEALDWQADLLVTHHPLFLRGVHGVGADTFKGSVVHRLIRGGCALYAAHTNADAAARGVADALARLLGLSDCVPLVPLAADPALGTGRVGALDEPMSLRAFAERVAASTRPTAQGVRVAGDLDASVRTVAVVGGSGDSLFDEVRAAGADVYVTADLRHHPASEQRERAGRDGTGRPYLVDLTHYASEWPWLDYAAEDLTARLAERAALDGREATVVPETRVSNLVTDPWTARFGSGFGLPSEGN